ncbi:hypothetical protein Q3G72_010147 [Acer saccharum]|nr:hypothetical protein Q3G72_008156 [Acer saccharum]KAK1548656.1 hypothetical protein Q3G72_010147 [Acer saccharum]
MIRGTKKDLLYELRYLADCLQEELTNGEKFHPTGNEKLLEAIQNRLRHIADSVETGELGRLSNLPRMPRGTPNLTLWYDYSHTPSQSWGLFDN